MAEKDVRQQEQCRMDTVVEKIHAAEDVRRQEIDRAKQEQRIVDADFKKNVRVKVSTYSGMMDTAMGTRPARTNNLGKISGTPLLCPD